MAIDDATLATIENALQVDGVYVDPSLAGQLPDAVQQQLRQAVADSAVPVYVVAVPLAYDDPIYQGQADLLFGTIHSDLGLDGVYIGVHVDTGPVRVTTTSFGSVDGTDAELGANAKAEALFPTDLGRSILTTIDLVGSGGGRAVFEKYHQSATTAQTSGSQGEGSSGDGSGSDPGSVAIGAGIIAVLVVGVLVVRLRGRRRGDTGKQVARGRADRRRDAGRHLTGRPFELSSSVLSTIRATQDDQLEKRADRAVLALGERIDELDLTASGNAASWQAALDHYDLARRILDRTHTAADVVGSIVLAARGQQALGDAVAGRAFVPRTPCYLNPLHGQGTRPTAWKGARGEVTVPLCAACATAVEAGREPDDVLDFVVRGTPRHYYDIEAEPWTSTGYGALDPDLTTRLFTDPR